MLLFEVLFLASLMVAVVMAGRWPGARMGFVLPMLAGLLLAAHLLLEKPRWQMVPLYLLALVVIGLALAGRPAQLPGKISLGILIALGALLPVLAPLDSLPKPEGPYTVGTMIFDWTDPNRPEIYRPGENRRIMVQVWYPAEMQPGAQRVLYHPDSAALQAPLAEFIEMPAFMLSHLGQVRTHAFVDLPAASGQERFPVLVFSHGWRGMRVQNTFQMEELASHGYVVFAADHTYGAIATVFSDGEVVGYNPEALPGGVPDEEYDRAARLLGQSWSGDIRFILDQAARLDAAASAGSLAGPLAGRLDLQRVGIFGHSTGGGAAIEACWQDQRCKAGLVMDAWLIPYDRQIPVEGLDQPFMFLFSETWLARRNPPLVNALIENARAEIHALTLSGTNHTSFSDLPLLSRIQTGNLFTLTPQERVKAYTLAFFDKYLKGAQPALLEPQATPLPGVVLNAAGR